MEGVNRKLSWEKGKRNNRFCMEVTDWRRESMSDEQEL